MKGVYPDVANERSVTYYIYDRLFYTVFLIQMDLAVDKTIGSG